MGAQKSDRDRLVQYGFFECLGIKPGGGLLGQKVYTPARTATRNPYPKWHKNCQTLPLVAQDLGPNPYPYWHISTKKGTLCGTIGVQKWFVCTIIGHFGAIFDIPCILHSSWHNQCKNHTLSGTHLVLKTLPLVAHCSKILPSVALKLVKMVPSPS